MAGGRGSNLMPMTDNSDPIDEPMEVEAGDRDVRVGVPDDGILTLTADAAEISALRLLDAAAKSREPR
jgi:hypothetical protein